MKQLSKYRAVLPALVAMILLVAQTAAHACPGCKQAPGAPLSGASIGFGVSILFMIAMVGALAGGLVYMAYQSCRALAQRDALALREADLSTGETA